MQNSKEGEKNSLRKSMKEAFEIVKPSKNVIKVGPKRKKKSIKEIKKSLKIYFRKLKKKKKR